MILKNIKKAKNIKELKELIQNIYSSKNIVEYIPAIIEEGKFTKENGEDFYLKLVLSHRKNKLENTWLKENMIFGIKDPDTVNKSLAYNVFTENIITFRNVKGNNLYQLNPNIMGSNINEYQYDNSNLVNAYYNEEYSNLKGKQVLKLENGTDIYLYTNVLKDYINELDSKTYPKYGLVAEFEYRTYNKPFENIKEGTYKQDDYIFDIKISSNNFIHILGSVKIEDPSFNQDFVERHIKVISLGTGRIRENNHENLDDDMEAGLVLFKEDVMDILEKYYYFYDLVMYDKENIENKYLVDVLDDKVVFWEGEYNKLPNFIKSKIDKFNYGSNEEIGIISPAMKAWQLDVDWDFHLKFTPEQELARLIKLKFFNAAIELDLSFQLIKDKDKLSDFIKKIEKLTKIKIEIFNQDTKDVKELLKIRNKEKVKINTEETKLLFRKYCIVIAGVISNE